VAVDHKERGRGGGDILPPVLEKGHTSGGELEPFIINHKKERSVRAVRSIVK